MKKFIFLIPMLLTLSSICQTSGYQPFPDSSAVWNVHGLFYGWPPPDDEFYSIVVSGDTLINSLIYHKLTTPYILSSETPKNLQGIAGYRGAYRQVAANRKVYYIPPTAVAEQLLYDFTLQEGDTVKGYLEPYSTKDIVEAIDSVWAGNGYHKRWLINSFYSIYLIEGIGSTYGLIEPSPGSIVDAPGYTITCTSLNGITVYPDPASACPVITSINPPVVDNHGFKVYPIPANGSISVEFDDPVNLRDIRLTDLVGNLLFVQKIRDQASIKINNLVNGTYFLTVTGNDNRATIRKIINCTN
jgi:hypothetical protein